MGIDRRNTNKNRRKKPKFISQSPIRFLQQVDSVMWDEELTADQRIHALDNIRRDSMRQYGYFTDGFRKIDKAITEALKDCKKCGEGTTDG